MKYLNFSTKNVLLQPYYNIFDEEVYIKLWTSKTEEQLKIGIKRELRKLKMNRLLNENKEN